MNKTAHEILDDLDRIHGVDNYSQLEIVEYTIQRFQSKWIKIESEKDLPKENDFYWVMMADGVFFVAEFVSHLRAFTMKGRYMDILTVTHYAPIIKPQPPKED